MNKVALHRPWPLTFSYGRALQATVLDVWQGKKENTAAAQKVLLMRAKPNTEAAQGKYMGTGIQCNTSFRRHIRSSTLWS